MAQEQTPAPDSPEALKQQLERAQRRLVDWPQLNRYKEANAKVPAPEKSEGRVVFMGDSITDGWKLDEYFADKPYINRGISGQTTPQMLIRFRPDVIALKPRAVLLLAGTNDIAGNTGPMTNEEIQGNIASMAELAKAHKIRVILSSILPTSNYHVGPSGVPQTQSRPMERIRAINDWMKKYAAAEGHVYLDYFTPMLDPSGLLRTELSADDLHPNAQGYAIMAPLADAAIRQALK
jgi:lysophospholipase L1-like esterase